MKYILLTLSAFNVVFYAGLALADPGGIVGGLSYYVYLFAGGIGLATALLMIFGKPKARPAPPRNPAPVRSPNETVVF